MEIHLSEKEFLALASAVAMRATELEDDDKSIDELRALDDGWSAINRAWHSKED